MSAELLEQVRDVVLAAAPRGVINVTEGLAVQALQQTMGMCPGDATAALSRAVEGGLLGHSVYTWYASSWKYYYAPLREPHAYASGGAYITALVKSQILLPSRILNEHVGRLPALFNGGKARLAQIPHLRKSGTSYYYFVCDWQDSDMVAILLHPPTVQTLNDVAARLISVGCLPSSWLNQPFVLLGRRLWHARNNLQLVTLNEGAIAAYRSGQVGHQDAAHESGGEGEIDADDKLEDAASEACYATSALDNTTDDDAEDVAQPPCMPQAALPYDLKIGGMPCDAADPQLNASFTNAELANHIRHTCALRDATPRWGIRAVCRGQLDQRHCGASRWGLLALSQINDERMEADMTHNNRRNGGEDTIHAFLKVMPPYHQWVLHGRLSRLRISTQCMRSLWHRQRIEHDAKSFGRRIRFDLWELRYPGWLILNVERSLGNMMFTTELEALLDELTVAAFPALCAVPDAVRGDVLIAFGRREKMPQLLRAMALHAPRYVAAGKGKITPRGIVTPTFLSASTMARTSWSESDWLEVKDRFKTERDSAVRRLIGAPGYPAEGAPW